MLFRAASRYDRQHLQPIKTDRSAALHWLHELPHQQPLLLRGFPLDLRIVPDGNNDRSPRRVYDGGATEPLLEHRDETIFSLEVDSGNTAHLDSVCLFEHLRTYPSTDEKTSRRNLQSCMRLFA